MSTVEETFQIIWTFVTAVLVFYMQTGFAMLEAGAVQKKNIKNILAKNTVDMCFSAITFWLFGFGIAFGCKHTCNKFIGDDNFLVSDVDRDFLGGKLDWFFQFAFAATSSTIVSGCVAERMEFAAYCFFTIIMSSVIYPVVAHWVWGGGWLFQKGVLDFAGGSVVHIVGGTAGFVGAWMIGPRRGRFEGRIFHVTVYDFPSYSSVFGALGVLIMWFGWYGFNCGSVEQFFGREKVIALVALNTTLGASSGLLSTLFLIGIPTRFKTLNLSRTLNGALAGLVSITAGAAQVQPGYALLIGAIGGGVYLGAAILLQQLKIDDPLDASPVHLFCGSWGMIATALFAQPEKVRQAFTTPEFNKFGLFYGDNSGELLAWHTVTIISVALWSGGLSAIIFKTCSLLGCFRVSEETELAGLDVMFHGASQQSLPLAVQRTINLTST